MPSPDNATYNADYHTTYNANYHYHTTYNANYHTTYNDDYDDRPTNDDYDDRPTNHHPSNGNWVVLGTLLGQSLVRIDFGSHFVEVTHRIVEGVQASIARL